MQITPLHGIEDEKKLDTLVRSMLQSGWKGRPLIVIDRGNEQQAITGSHRIVSAEVAGIEPEYVEITEPTECDEEIAELFEIMMNSDDEERLDAIIKLNKMGLASDKVVEIMMQEVEGN